MMMLSLGKVLDTQAAILIQCLGAPEGPPRVLPMGEGVVMEVRLGIMQVPTVPLANLLLAVVLLVLVVRKGVRVMRIQGSLVVMALLDKLVRTGLRVMEEC